MEEAIGILTFLDTKKEGRRMEDQNRGRDWGSGVEKPTGEPKPQDYSWENP